MGRVGNPDAEPTSNSIARRSISTWTGIPRTSQTISAVSVALESGEVTIHSTAVGTDAAAWRACSLPTTVSGESTPLPAKMPAALASLSPCRRNQVGMCSAYSATSAALGGLVCPNYPVIGNTRPFRKTEPHFLMMQGPVGRRRRFPRKRSAKWPPLVGEGAKVGILPSMDRLRGPDTRAMQSGWAATT